MDRSKAWTIGAGVGIAAATGIGAGLAAWAGKRLLSSRADLGGKVALITGGSRGLGLQLARELAAEGCRLVICSRHPEQLEAARHDLESRGAEVLAVVCDVRNREEVENLVRRATEHFGAVDLLINNAGVIQVGPIETMGIEDFEDAMATMFWSNVYTTFAVLPQMRARRSGHIVNITSIGGKISVPHLVPYSCAKFAAVALSEGLHAELGKDGIHVTTVVPGLMRTGSHRNAKFRGNHSREYLWFSLGAASPFASISAERAARQVVRAIHANAAECVLGAPANLAVRIHGAFPELTLPVMKFVSQAALPEGADKSTKRGHEAERELNSRLLNAINTLGNAAALELNETPV